MKCFISYRREDSRSTTERIYDLFVSVWKVPSLKIDSISEGTYFRHQLRASLLRCDVLLAMVGDRWLNITNPQGQRRIDDEEDLVRIEIETALAKEIKIIPVLVHDARMPVASELPESMQRLAFIQGLKIRYDPDFHHDTANLVRLLVEIIIDGLINEAEVAPSPFSFSNLKTTKLFDSFSKTIEEDSLNAEALMKRGQMAYVSARQFGGEGYKQALNDFRKVVGMDSRFADPHFGLGTVYYDIATFDLVKRHRYTIHEKGKMRVNKTTGIPEMKPPLMAFFPDDQTKSILTIALNEFESGNKLRQYYSQDKNAITYAFAPADLDKRIHSIRGILGYEPLKPYDETFMGVFTMFHTRMGEEGLFEIVE